MGSFTNTSQHINCTEECIGESGRTFGGRFKEYLKTPSPIHQHTSTTGHSVSPDCFSIVYRQSQGLTRNIKEAMFIMVRDPSLNRIWTSSTFHMFGTKFCRTHQHFTSNKPTLLIPSKPYPSTGPPCSPNGHSVGHILLLLLVHIPSRGTSVLNLILPNYPIPTTPYPPQTVPSLVSTHIYLISIIFSPGPDEAATVWWL